MHPEQIKAAIRMKGTTPSVLADELEVSRSTMSQVISGRGTSARVKTRIAEVTGLSVATLWPSRTDYTKLRRPTQTPAQKLAASDRRDQTRRESERRDGERWVAA